MEITVKLFPTLRLPAAKDFPAGEEFTISLTDIGPSHPTIRDLIGYLKIPQKKVHQAVLNGRIVHDFSHRLQAGDYIYLSPAIGGG